MPPFKNLHISHKNSEFCNEKTSDHLVCRAAFRPAEQQRLRLAFFSWPQSPPSPAALLSISCWALGESEFTTLGSSSFRAQSGPQSLGNLTDDCLSVLRNLNGHLFQLSSRNLNPVYSFLDDKKPSNLCLNTSSKGELTTPRGSKFSLTFFSHLHSPVLGLCLSSVATLHPLPSTSAVA